MNDNIVEYDYDCKKLFIFVRVMIDSMTGCMPHVYQKILPNTLCHYVFTPHRVTCLYITNQCPVLSG